MDAGNHIAYVRSRRGRDPYSRILDSTEYGLDSRIVVNGIEREHLDSFATAKVETMVMVVDERVKEIRHREIVLARGVGRSLSTSITQSFHVAYGVREFSIR